MKMVDLLEQTKKTLQEKTWVPHPPSRTHGETCLVMALPEHHHRGEAYNLLALAVFGEAGCRSLSEFNDRCTSVEEVLAVLDRAIKMLEAEAGDVKVI